MNDLTKYLRKVSTYLPGTKKQTQGIIKLLKEDVLSDAANLSFDQIVERFGTPAAMAATQIEIMPALEIAEKVRFQKWIKKLIIVIASIIILLFAGLCIAEYVDAYNASHGQIIREDPTHVNDGTNPSTE
ncbi:MAG: hypothetical protein IKR93_06095 [Firmicutes bacterium]|nr:hypothetical protein [Bacillota bacterium]